MNKNFLCKTFFILILFTLLVLISSYVFASFKITSAISEELNYIYDKVNNVYTIRNIIKIVSVILIILVIINLNNLRENSNIKFLLLLAIAGLISNFALSRISFSEESISNLYATYTSNDFCCLYRGELITFRYPLENQNIILICQKNKLEDKRIDNSINSILAVLLKDYPLSSSLYNELVNSRVTNDYFKFEENPEKTDFEKSILDDSFEFIRITYDESKLLFAEPPTN